jgi:ribosome-binding factor A
MAQAIRESVSSAILFELKDPRVQQVTVVGVEVGADLRSAKVFVSILGDSKTQSLSIHGLRSARGFLQSRIADRLSTRYTPVLEFVIDDGVKRSIETAELLREIEIAEGDVTDNA